MKHKLLILFLFIITGCWATTPYKTYSVVDGLPNSTIKAICQDSMGYIYLGTRNGLARFDGYEFRNYNYGIQKENTVYNNDITCMTQDGEGRIWIGTFNWITLFDPLSEEFIELDLQYPEGIAPKGVVTNIYIDKQKRVWISLKTGLYMLEDREVKTFKSVKGAPINSMSVCDHESLLLEIIGKGLALFNTYTYELSYLDESLVENRSMIYKIFRDSKGKVWIGADTKNLFLYQPDNRSVIPVKLELGNGIKFDNEQIHDILEYNDSILVLGTDNGLLIINSRTNSFCKDASGILPVNLLQDHRIMSLYKDRQGALWVGTFNKGVKYCNPGRYYFNYYQWEVNKNMPVSIAGNLVENDGILWIGHEHGISLMDMKTGKFSSFNLHQLPAQDTKTELFFMYQSLPHLSYLYFLNKGTYSLHLDNQRIGENIGLPSASQVRSMKKDINGNVWIAEEELSVYNPVTGDLNANLSTNFNNITNFMLSQDLLLRYNGNMLVGTRTSGLWEYPYDELTGKYLNGEKLDIEPLRDKNINVLFEDSKNNVWVGTYGSGLYQCNPENKKYILFSVDNGLVHNSICGILEDDASGDIWVATLNGLSKIEQPSGKITNYTNKTGFPLEEVSRKAFLKGMNGLFYIGGSNGLSSFDPEIFRSKSFDPPTVRVSLVESLNTKKDVNQPRFGNFRDLQQVEFPFNHSSVIIKFSTLNYFYPNGNRYAYKLKKLEEDWRYTERNEAVYSNLPEGNYIFCVKACDNEGVWSEKITEIPIKIHPPIWRTTWAKLLYLCLISILFYFIVQFFYNRKTLKYRQQINRIEKENIEKYYQMKLELFTKFSHELRTPLTLITGPTEDLLNNKSFPEELLYLIQLIHKNANRLLLLVNQLMDFRKIEHGSMTLKIRQVNIDLFLSDQIDNFTELSGKKGIALTYLNQYWGKDVWFDCELMEKVIFNLISNAIKHSQREGEIIISSKEREKQLIISVKDNGDGIAPEYQEEIFNPFFQVHPRSNPEISGSGIGLNFAKYIVNLHRGEIRVQSELGKGAEFFVQLPLGVEHFDPMHTEIEAPASEIRTENQARELMASSIEVENPTEKSNMENTVWILIVEDDDDLRHYIASFLSAEYSIIEASDGKEALVLAIEKLPDLIISDVMMPQTSGIELCKQVKDDMRTAHIPVILLTAKVMSEYIQKGFEALADDYILKPFHSGLLKVRVRNLINNRIQLRKIFSKQLTILDVPTVELSSSDSFMEKMIEIIKCRIDDSELSINDLSQEMGVSRAQLFRKTKAISDVSPNKLILNIRMKMAADYLKQNQYTIAEVAYKTGFSDPAYFSKMFKVTFNITPSDFVKR